MKLFKRGLAVAVLLIAAALMSTSASATQITGPIIPYSGVNACDQQALKLYPEAYKQFGAQAVGRNKAEDGKLTAEGHAIPLTPTESCAWRDTLHAMLHPPIAPSPGVSEAPDGSGSISSAGWEATAACESSGNWADNTGNGYYGGLQEDLTFWHNYGNPAYANPAEAPASEQIAAAQKGLAAQGPNAWPHCPTP